MQYQTLRSVSDNHVFVVCYDGRFDELPDHVRHRAHGRECIAARLRSSRLTTVGHSLETATRSLNPGSRCSSRRPSAGTALRPSLPMQAAGLLRIFASAPHFDPKPLAS